MMAEGWARYTGWPGVAVVTAGPGVVNSFPGVAIAHQTRAPVVVIAGRSSLARRDLGAMQDVDQVEIMRPVTKWARTVLRTERIPDHLSTAFRQAVSGRPARWLEGHPFAAKSSVDLVPVRLRAPVASLTAGRGASSSSEPRRSCGSQTAAAARRPKTSAVREPTCASASSRSPSPEGATFARPSLPMPSRFWPRPAVTTWSPGRSRTTPTWPGPALPGALSRSRRRLPVTVAASASRSATSGPGARKAPSSTPPAAPAAVSASRFARRGRQPWRSARRPKLRLDRRPGCVLGKRG